MTKKRGSSNLDPMVAFNLGMALIFLVFGSMFLFFPYSVDVVCVNPETGNVSTYSAEQTLFDFVQETHRTTKVSTGQYEAYWLEECVIGR